MRKSRGDTGITISAGMITGRDIGSGIELAKILDYIGMGLLLN